MRPHHSYSILISFSSVAHSCKSGRARVRVEL